ncbi:MAG: hypothetical protein HYR63_18355 [Proteobacteria bacterium]|nr:hypothetical protein [Pseudomonadota bacterium]MBI3499502.1 hypothetical protein [Pseudomonadota bacterium]
MLITGTLRERRRARSGLWLKEVGFNADLQVMDWSTVVTRRQTGEALEKIRPSRNISKN